ncbi:hypothetical protein [Thauera sinica]|uniref:C2H2-type domain-containing protein n=1 Tax=Thauera sinica TaxID=2665146 RepID=A0ABW1AYB3_9RHOO|nr:hypothetical protein [Thauera sp. K11]
MSTTHFNCPSCHTPVARDRFEHAFGETDGYWVCPECDFTFNVPASLWLHERRRVEAPPAGESKVKQACSTSV